jgi:preprotein translocase subunit SecA
LRQGIHLRGYGQRDPLNEYKKEAFVLFEGMLTNLRQMVTRMIGHLEVRPQQQQAAAEGEETEQLAATGTDGVRPSGPPRPARAARPILAAAATGPGAGRSSESWGKVPRNAPCPCGSGKKYKHCHGRLH